MQKKIVFSYTIGSDRSFHDEQMGPWHQAQVAEDATVLVSTTRIVRQTRRPEEKSYPRQTPWRASASMYQLGKR